MWPVHFRLDLLDHKDREVDLRVLAPVKDRPKLSGINVLGERTLFRDESQRPRYLFSDRLISIVDQNWIRRDQVKCDLCLWRPNSIHLIKLLFGIGRLISVKDGTPNRQKYQPTIPKPLLSSEEKQAEVAQIEERLETAKARWILADADQRSTWLERMDTVSRKLAPMNGSEPRRGFLLCLAAILNSCHSAI